MAESASAAVSERAPAMRRGVRVVAFVLLIAVVLGLLVLIEARTGGAKRPQGAGAAGAPVEVSVVELAPRTVELRPRFLGRTEASQTVEIRTRVAGFLDERSFEEGTKVEAGTRLFRIDARPFEASVSVVRAQLESAKARLLQAQNQLRRVRSLIEQGGGTPVELEQAETDERVALASVHLSEAQLQQAELDLGYTTIAAPITGMIGRAQKDVGTFVQAGEAGLLATVDQVDPIYVVYSVSEQDLLGWRRMIDAGQVVLPESGRIPLTLELIDGSEFPHAGSVNFIDVKVDSSTGSAAARGVFPNPDAALRPGQFVRVTVEGIRRPGTLVVPKEAVIQTPSSASVYVVAADSRAELRPVTLGDWTEDGWIVVGGLRAGERVVTDMVSRLRPGAPVRSRAAGVTAPERPGAEGAGTGEKR